MKKQLHFMLFIALGLLGTTSCSKDSNLKPIDAVGSYQGDLSIHLSTGKFTSYDNSIVTVTQVGEGQLKFTTNPASGSVSETFDVYEQNGTMSNDDDDPKGVFVYIKDENSLSVSTLGSKATKQILFTGQKIN
ncbi:hypothetical protein [Sphingobacterium mizutaii]|uniref:hypothetical protein n=1 Tax=Sphingobacterium mizutaii TaxID=1010 RepID=UPI0028A1CC9E|nr:hypothetical protein [Sphingobacterium mizutaii]